MSGQPDYYGILGVNRDATAEQVRRAYRRAVLRYHPDRYRGDKIIATRIFHRLSEAYAVLRDPLSRRLYDHQTRPAEPARGFTPAELWEMNWRGRPAAGSTAAAVSHAASPQVAYAKAKACVILALTAVYLSWLVMPAVVLGTAAGVLGVQAARRLAPYGPSYWRDMARMGLGFAAAAWAIALAATYVYLRCGVL